MTTCTDRWDNCYETGWKNWIVPDAFSHPAKFSRCLIERIYDHAFEMEWVKEGDCILDPFAGVALGGLCAMSMGLNWVGVELEEKFVKLGEQNIILWNSLLSDLPNLGTATILQGDSRKLIEVVKKADLVVSSPPYCEPPGHGGKPTEIDLKKATGGNQQLYGHTPGNLANMKEGSIDAVISSPPYSEGIGHGHAGENADKKSHSERYNAQEKYASAFEGKGNLGAMREGSFDMCMSSPPYERDIIKARNSHLDVARMEKKGYKPKGTAGFTCGKLSTEEYSKDKSNLGNSSGDTFWSASREIVQQCYELLKPGGHAIWVTKDYVKNKQRVPFSDKWLALCETVGFKLVYRHQAMLVGINNKGEYVERKSFFRRLAEKTIRANNHWNIVSRSDQAKYIRKSKKNGWIYYRKMVGDNDPDHPPIFPTKPKVVHVAKLYALNDYPGDVRDWDDERIIGWEDVLCLEK